MSRPRRDATVIFQHQALAHCLKALFESKSLIPDEAVADAIGVDRDRVKESQFMVRLDRGNKASIPGTELQLQDVVCRLREKDWIRPATEMWGATLWSFLRGELTPDVGIAGLLDHHLARVRFTRIATVQDFVSRLAARAEIEMFSEAFPLVVARTRLVDIPEFLHSSIPVTDKLTIAGLLYVKAYLGGDSFRAALLEKNIRAFGDSGAAKRAFGKCAGELWVEIQNRLFQGQLPYSYGQRFTEASPCDVLLPIDAGRNLDIFIKAGLAGVKIYPDEWLPS